MNLSKVGTPIHRKEDVLVTLAGDHGNTLSLIPAILPIHTLPLPPITCIHVSMLVAAVVQDVNVVHKCSQAWCLVVP